MASLNLSRPPTRIRVPRGWTLGIAVALSLAVAVAILTALDIGGRALLWENVGWTLSYSIGLALAIFGVMTARGPERRVRAAIALASACWLAAQIVWATQVMVGMIVVPAPSDILALAAIIPAIVALDLAVRQVVDRRERLGLYLDTVIMFLATAAVMTLLFGHLVHGQEVLAGALLLTFPLGCLSLTGAGVMTALAMRARPRHGGIYAMLIGTFLWGAAYLPWVANAPDVTPPGAWTNYLFSAGALMLGLGGATFRIDSRTTRKADRP